MDAHSLLSAPCPTPPTRSDALLADYKHFLEDVRGLFRTGHQRTVSCFLEHVGYESALSQLADLKACDIETFITHLGKQHCRASLQHEAAHIRSFLRFGAASGTLPPGLDAHVDTPRLYRLEQLPRTLPWENVCALLASIDHSSPMGMRNYAMLFLIATYGLRACDIRALRLEDIHWRQEEIRVAQRKTGQPLVLPLTDALGDVLVQYLRNGRPRTSARQLFLRVRAPMGPLGYTGVNDAFKGCVKRSGLKLPFTGIHCLRHSYALHLLRQGTSLKTIGDLLGHRTAESTCVYLRLAIEESLSQSKPSSLSTSIWAMLLARIYEIFPLVCPLCGGEMEIISYITDPLTVQAILNHVGEPTKPPPITPARGPPVWEIPDQEPVLDTAQTEPEYNLDQTLNW